jgi:hypothetical protein
MTKFAHIIGLLCLATIAMSCNFGCGFGSTPHPADPGAAQDALRVALDGWKAGQKPADFETRAQPIVIKDLDWTEGYQLVGYTAAAEGRLAGYDMTYPVTLELKSPKGKTLKREAVYTVTTRPQVLVLRQEG